jgi:hypothetical protein
MATYGCTALGTHDVLAGEAGTAAAGYTAGCRTCGHWMVITTTRLNPEEGPT